MASAGIGFGALPPTTDARQIGRDTSSAAHGVAASQSTTGAVADIACPRDSSFPEGSATGRPSAGRLQLASDLRAALHARGLSRDASPPPLPPSATDQQSAPQVLVVAPSAEGSGQRHSIGSSAADASVIGMEKSPGADPASRFGLPTLVGKTHSGRSSVSSYSDLEDVTDLMPSERDLCMDMIKQTTSLKSALRFRMVAEEQAGQKQDELCGRTVVCACNVMMIRDINPVNATFNCRFTIALEWIDPAAVGMPLGKVHAEARKKLSIPEIGLQNALAASLEVHSPPLVLDDQTGHVTQKILFQAVVQMDLDMRKFPFDTQRLPLILGLRSRRDRDRAIHCRFCHVHPGIRLDEWSILSKFCSASRPDGRACAEFGVVVVRAYWYYVMNVLLTLVFLTTLAFFGRLLELDNLFDRLRIGFGILLAQTTFRMSIENKLPKVSYATAFDSYSMCCQLAVIGIIISNVAINLMKVFGLAESTTDLIDYLSYALIIAAWLLYGVYSALSMRKHVNELRQSQDEEEGTTGPPSELAQCLAPEALRDFTIMEEAPSHIRPSLSSSRQSVELRSQFLREEVHERPQVVVVTVKVWLLFVDPLATTFECRFTVYLEWYDEKAVGAPTGERLDAKQLKNYHMPQVRGDGAISFSIEDGPSGYIGDSEKGMVVAKSRYITKYPMHLDLTRFPFDEQMLMLSVQVSEEDPEQMPRPVVVSSFTLLPGCTHFEEWTKQGERVCVDTSNGEPEVQLAIFVSRRSAFYIRSILAVLLGISSTVFTLFVVDLRAFSDQGKIFMPLLMTMLMFKFSVANTIPRVANFTIFDRYVLGCQALYLFSAVVCAITLVLDEYEVCSVDMAEAIRRSVAALLALAWALCNAWVMFESLKPHRLMDVTDASDSCDVEALGDAPGARPLSLIMDELKRPLSEGVRLSVDVQRIHSVSPATSSFACDFEVTLSWIDAAAQGIANGTKLPKDWPGATRHPLLFIDNATQMSMTPVGAPEVVDGEVGHVSMKILVRAKLRLKLSLARFPFDEQALAVVLSLPEPQDCHRFFALDRFSGASRVCVGEWAVLGSFAARTPANSIVFGVRMLRFSRYFVQHMFTLCIFSLFTMLVYMQDVSEFAVRAKMLVGVMLVQVVAKIQVGTKLPCMASVTVFDECALYGLEMLFTVFFSCAVCSSLLMVGISHTAISILDGCLGMAWFLTWFIRMKGVVSRVRRDLQKSRNVAEDALPEAVQAAPSIGNTSRVKRLSVTSILGDSLRSSFGSSSSSQEFAESIVPPEVLMELAKMKRATECSSGRNSDCSSASSAMKSDGPSAEPLPAVGPEAPPALEEDSEARCDELDVIKGNIVLGVKVWGVSDIDIVSSTFDVKFHMFLGWRDPAAVGKPVGLVQPQTLKDLGVEVPEITLSNALTLLSVSMANFEVVDSEIGLVSCRLKYHARMEHKFVLASFPLDCQNLAVNFEVKPLADQTQRWFVQEFCEINVQDEDLENWRLITTILASDSKPQEGVPSASLIFVVQRSYWYYVRVKSILALTSSLCLSFYLLDPPDNLANRIIDTLKIVLTQTTFRFSVEPRLPKVPFWTPFDVYAVSCTLLFVCISLGFFVVARLKVTLIDQGDLNYLTMASLLGCWAVWNLGYWTYLINLRSRELRQTLAANPPAMKMLKDVSFLDELWRRSKTYDDVRRGDTSKMLLLPKDAPMPDLNPQLVSIAFRIWLVRNIDPIKGTFECKFRIFLEWFDKQALGVDKGKKLKHLQVPEIILDNAITHKVLDKSSAPEVVNSTNGHVAAQMLFQGTLKMDHEVQLFPFDCQWLAIAISLKNEAEIPRSFLFQYCELDGRLQFEEWEVHGDPAYSTLTKHDAQSVMCGVLVRRCPRYYVVNIMGMLCLITLLSLTIFAIKQSPGALSWERWEVLLAIFPLIVLFKVSAAGKLPRVNYKTMFDTYTLGCQRIFILIAVNSVIATIASSQTPQLPHSLFNEWACLTIAVLWLLWNVKTAFFAWKAGKLRPEEALRFRTPVPLRLQDAAFMESYPLMESALSEMAHRDSFISDSGAVSPRTTKRDTPPIGKTESEAGSSPTKSPSIWSRGVSSPVKSPWFRRGWRSDHEGAASDSDSPVKTPQSRSSRKSSQSPAMSVEDQAILHVRKRVTWQPGQDK